MDPTEADRPLFEAEERQLRKRGVLPPLDGEVFSESESEVEEEADEEQILQAAIKEIVGAADLQVMSFKDVHDQLVVRFPPEIGVELPKPWRKLAKKLVMQEVNRLLNGDDEDAEEEGEAEMQERAEDDEIAVQGENVEDAKENISDAEEAGPTKKQLKKSVLRLIEDADVEGTTMRQLLASVAAENGVTELAPKQRKIVLNVLRKAMMRRNPVEEGVEANDGDAKAGADNEDWPEFEDDDPKVTEHSVESLQMKGTTNLANIDPQLLDPTMLEDDDMDTL